MLFRLIAVASAFFILGAALPAAAAMIVSTPGPRYTSDAQRPNVFELDNSGGYVGQIFQPFSIGDLAWQKGSLLVGHSGSGTIARMESNGGLRDVLYTGLNSIGALAASSDGSIYASENNSNTLYKLNSNGVFEDLSFLPFETTALGTYGDSTLLMPVYSTNSTRDPMDVVFWDFELGEQTRFSTALYSIVGIASVHDEILVVGSESSYYSSERRIYRFSSTGTLLGQITGPAGIESITAHTPEPGTALLLGIGLAGLSRTSPSRRKRA